MISNKFLVLIVSLLVLRASSQALVDQLLVKPDLLKNKDFLNNEAISAFLAEKSQVASQYIPGYVAASNILGNWNIININGKTVNVSAVINHNSIQFDYCDSMNYLYKKSGNNLSITSNWTRQVACCRMANGLFQDEVEQTFVNSTNFVLAGNQLIFKDKFGNQKVRLVRQISSSTNLPLDKINGSYRATNVRGKSVNVNVTISDTSISYKYCNSKTMTYFLQNSNAIKIIPGFSTMMACLNQNPTESDFDSAFSSAVRYSRVGSQIRLFDAAGLQTVILEVNNVTTGVVTNPSPIVGVWTTTSVNDRDLAIVVNITEKNIQFTYCNTKSYPYTLSGNTISLGVGVSTKIYCANLDPSESFVGGAFSSAATYSVAKNGLVFFDSKGRVVVRLTAGNQSVVTPSIPSFVGNWTATNVNGKSVSFNVTITNSSIQYTYCNGKNIQYKIKGNSISLSPGMSTLMFCEGLNPSESDVDKAFNSAVSYKLDSGRLCLLDSNGRVVVTLETRVATRNLKTIQPIRIKSLQTV